MSFEKLQQSIGAVPLRLKKKAQLEWEKLEDLIDALEPLVGTATDSKKAVPLGDEFTSLRKAIEANHANYEGSETSKVGTRTRFGQMLENIRIATSNVQPLVPDNGDTITLQIIKTLADIAAKTPKTALE